MIQGKPLKRRRKTKSQPQPSKVLSQKALLNLLLPLKKMIVRDLKLASLNPMKI
jgi:hypothetical protein